MDCKDMGALLASMLVAVVLYLREFMKDKIKENENNIVRFTKDDAHAMFLKMMDDKLKLFYRDEFPERTKPDTPNNTGGVTHPSEPK